MSSLPYYILLVAKDHKKLFFGTCGLQLESVQNSILWSGLQNQSATLVTIKKRINPNIQNNLEPFLICVSVVKCSNLNSNFESALMHTVLIYIIFVSNLILLGSDHCFNIGFYSKNGLQIWLLQQQYKDTRTTRRIC